MPPLRGILVRIKRDYPYRLRSDRSLGPQTTARPQSQPPPPDWTTTPPDHASPVRPRSDWTEVALLPTLCSGDTSVSGGFYFLRQRNFTATRLFRGNAASDFCAATQVYDNANQVAAPKFSL